MKLAGTEREREREMQIQKQKNNSFEYLPRIPFMFDR